MLTGSCWLFGWIFCIAIMACMSTDLEHTVGNLFGQPMAQIFYDALGKNGVLEISSSLPPYINPGPFPYDGVLPFSSFFRPISKTFGYIHSAPSLAGIDEQRRQEFRVNSSRGKRQATLGESYFMLHPNSREVANGVDGNCDGELKIILAKCTGKAEYSSLFKT
jgi:hypothetical protein